MDKLEKFCMAAMLVWSAAAVVVIILLCLNIL